jgi:two-component system, NarL family, nitrate/nitrite response regulator NarL
VPESRRKIRVLIADDHPIVRYGLRRLLEDAAEFRVVGEAADGGEAVALARQLSPDVLLLDVSMPRLSGLEALRQLSISQSPVLTVLLSESLDNGKLIEAVRLGARGVVFKESAPSLMVKALRSVMAGQYWVGRDTVADLVRSLQESRSAPAGPEPKPGSRLTPREREMVAAVTAGRSNKEIAAKLAVSEDTVKHHLTNIFDKLGLSNRIELAVFAIENRLVVDA